MQAAIFVWTCLHVKTEFFISETEKTKILRDVRIIVWYGNIEGMNESRGFYVMINLDRNVEFQNILHKMDIIL